MDLGGLIAGFAEFSDHYSYSRFDVQSIWRKAAELEVDHVITTEKDYVRLGNKLPETPNLLVLSISIFFGNYKDDFDGYLMRRISELTSSRRAHEQG